MKVNFALRGLVGISLVAFLTGCGQGFNSGGSSGATSAQSVILSQEKQISEIQSQAASAEQALADAQAALDNLVQNGQVVMPTPAVGSSLNVGGLTGIDKRLKAILDQTYGKLKTSVDKAKALVDQARAELAVAMAKLDPKDPQQAQLLAKMQAMLAKLDQIEARFHEVYQILAAKVDLLINKMDELMAKVDTSKPWNLIVLNELQAVRQVLVDFRDRLANS